MQLSTKIVATSSPLLQKILRASFDHDFSILPLSTSDGSFEQTMKYPCWAESTLNWTQSQPDSAQCIITYNIDFDTACIRPILSNLKCFQSIKIQQYHFKTGELKSTREFRSQHQPFEQLATMQLEKSSLYCLELTLKEKVRKNIYFMPMDSKTELPTSASHQMLKLLYFLRVYLSLQLQSEEHSKFQDQLSIKFNYYLHQSPVNRVNILIGLPQGEIPEQKIIQQVGKLILPQQWRQKSEYRNIKRQIHFIRHSQEMLLQKLKASKMEVVGVINELQKLSGFPQIKYSQITVERLRELKIQCFSQKVSIINELDLSLQAIEVRLNQLRERKEELQQQKINNQHQQNIRMAQLKTQILKLQNQQAKAKKLNQSNFIYQKTDKTHPIKQLFDKSKQLGQLSATINNYVLPSTNRSIVAKNKAKQSDRKDKITSVKKAEKKVVSVVKSNLKKSEDINIGKLRGQFDKEVLGVDFEFEKKMQQKQMYIKRGTLALKKLIEGSQDLQLMME